LLRSALRPVAAGLVVLSSLVSAGLPSACASRDCTLLGCDSLHARITAHVGVPPPALAASTTTVCWRDVCADLVGARADAGGDGTVSFDPRASLLMGEATITPEGSAASLLQIDLRFFTRGRGGDFVYTRQANGDRYRVAVVDAAGQTLFSAERAATYDESFPNGPDCDPEPCRRANLELFAQ
jgi:hypothetical protein